MYHMVTKLMHVCFSTFIYFFFIISGKTLDKHKHIYIWPWKISYFCWKITEIFIFIFIFFMTSWSCIFLLDDCIFTCVTDNNKEEIEQKIISTSTWNNLAMFLKVLAYYPHKIRLLDLVGRICRKLFQL